MKKGSVPTKRAALFTGIVMAVTVAVSLLGFFLASWLQTDAAVRRPLVPQAETLAALAAENPADASDRLAAEARLVASSGGIVWLVDENGRADCLTGEQAWPDDIGALARAGKSARVRIDGRRYAYADAPIGGAGDGYRGKAAVAVPLPGMAAGPALLVVLFAALLGAAAGSLALRTRMRAEKRVREAMKPIVQLRKTAVSMAEGHLELRANEDADGEVGALGKAVNNLSHQLSRNMYTLIVERNRLKNMLNGLSEGIVAIDSEGRVTHTNPALDRFFQAQKLALHLPDPRMKLIPDKSIWEDFDGVIRTGEPMTRNLESRDMILRLTITPIVDEIDAIVGAVGLFSDITQMERLERTRRDYVSNVSHELRTPLTAMRALVEPLKEGMVTDEPHRQRYYDILLRETQRLSRLIDDQLELSRLQSGTLLIQKRVLRMEDMMCDLHDRFDVLPERRTKDIQLRVETDFSQCPPIYADADRVDQLLVILLDNAIKYTEAGYVTVSADWDDERVVVHVKDTGIGIEENDLPYVFDRFYKVDKAHSGKGSGLGLSIAKELLKRMDEDIWVTSEKGVGTEFSFTLHCPTQEQLSGEAGAQAE